MFPAHTGLADVIGKILFLLLRFPLTITVEYGENNVGRKRGDESVKTSAIIINPMHF
jgi:hypothetical protein